MPNTQPKTIDPRWAWQRYRPSDEAPWDLKRVGHLYRRAAFGATMDELATALLRVRAKPSISYCKAERTRKALKFGAC